MTRSNLVLLIIAIVGLPSVILLAQLVESPYRVIVGTVLYLVVLAIAGLVVKSARKSSDAKDWHHPYDNG